MDRNLLRSRPGQKDVKVNAKLTPSEYLDLEFIAKRLNLRKANGDINISASIATAIKMAKKELTEPTIKF